MTQTIEQLQQRLEALEALIRETQKRLPAHSVKPPVMMDLIAYEDEYEALLNRLRKMKSQDTAV